MKSEWALEPRWKKMTDIIPGMGGRILRDDNFIVNTVQSIFISVATAQSENALTKAALDFGAYSAELKLKIEDSFEKFQSADNRYGGGKFDFIIAGVKKCGTTALSQFIRFHPQIALANIYQGEGHYFDIGCRSQTDSACLQNKNMMKFSYYVTPKQRSRYPSVNKQILKDTPDDLFRIENMTYFDKKKIIGEKSPNYFIESRIPKRIRQYNPNAKVIMVLCEPSSRAYSDYVHFEKNAKFQSRQTKLLGLVSTEKFRKINESFEEYVNRADQFFRESDNLSEKLQLLGDLDDNLFDQMSADWKNTRNTRNTRNDGNFLLLKIKAITKLNEKIERDGFDSKYQLIANGYYHYYLAKWFEEIGKENILILSSEGLVANPYTSMKQLEDFFNLDKYFTKDMFQKPYNSSFYCVDKKHAVLGYPPAIRPKSMRNPFPFTIFERDYNPELNETRFLYCLSKNKGRTRNTPKLPQTEIALLKLKLLYKEANNKLFQMIGKTFNWS